jgi:NodT family efflux transporter outer membrane factor (OMF) lipoprotein
VGGTTARGATAGASNVVTATLGASWEPDLWGQIRRGIESSKDSAQATDAQLAGVRLSIASSVAIDYLALRQLDMDIGLLERQQAIDARLLEMTRASFAQGTASNDMVLAAEDTLQLVAAMLQASQMSREQFEHAIAALVGKPPAGFSIASRPGYEFAPPQVPLVLPSELLERRPDVVAAERLAAAANARIGVAQAAFFPSLMLSAQGGFQGSALATLFSLPNRLWTLGPALAATLFDGGARTAAVHQAQATYDQDVATYRQTVLTAFQNVEDSLSACNHLREQANAYAAIYRRNQQLLESQRAQLLAGTASEQTVLMQQLVLLSAEQILRDTQGLLAQDSVTLVMNLGGGWQQDGAKQAQ